MSERDLTREPRIAAETSEPGETPIDQLLEAAADQLATDSAEILLPDPDPYSTEGSPPTSSNASLAEEGVALKERIRARTEQAERLRGLAEKIEKSISDDRHSLQELEDIFGESSQLGIDDFDRRLGGQQLERVAIRLLGSQLEPGTEIHYRDWFKLIGDQGFKVGGQNPLGTFLAQVNRSSAIERVGNRTGIYRLRG